MFTGSMVALVTPMQHDGSIDKPALHALVEWHIDQGTDALVIAGTTGESATLDADEHEDLLRAVVKQVKGRLPVIAGAGTNATRSTLRLVENAKKAGADAVLLVTPYYNKPPQQGLFEHFKTVAEIGDMPIILYNVPSRTACDMLPGTVEKLSTIQNIVGIKEATGQLERAQEILALCGPDFAIYSGDDATALNLMLNSGAKGVISVTANVAPNAMKALCQAALAQDVATATTINDKLALLHERLFLESNPIPSKWALEIMGKIQSGIRLPLLPFSKQNHEALLEAMKTAEIMV